MLKLGIRVSTEASSGRGHFQRCLNIRHYINEKVCWFVDGESSFIKNRIPNFDKLFVEKDRNNFLTLKKYIQKSHINCVLIDSYHINVTDFYNINLNVPIIALIDKNIRIKADLVVSPQPIDLELQNDVKYLCGPKYSPINSIFFNNDKKKFFKNKILISFGAYDNNRISINVVKAIKNILLSNSWTLDVVILLGKDSLIINEIRTLIKNFKNFQLIIEPKNIENIYNECNIALGAPGLSYMERLASGLPNILIPQNNIHIDLIDKWVKLGCAIKAENSIRSIQDSLNLLILDNTLKNKLIKTGHKFIDGKGGVRIAKAIKKLVNFYD